MWAQAARHEDVGRRGEEERTCSGQASVAAVDVDNARLFKAATNGCIKLALPLLLRHRRTALLL
jgi:hypothetical protein